jgi:creatinine amidohydrolase/Fe(II)-dependent formamide hydrolase-like protein
MDTSKAAPLLKGQQRKLAILPIGSCEQHGPFLPLDTDLRIAQLIAEKLEKSFSHPSSNVETILLPSIPFSCSWEHKGLGTVALNVSTVAAILHDIAKSLKAWNTPFLLLVVNWHGGNDLLGALTTEITATEEIAAAVIPSTTQVGKAWDESGITKAKDVHAGAIEVSVVQAYWPELTIASFPETSHCEPNIKPVKVQSALQALGSYKVTRDGTWGAPEQADPEKGRQLIENLVRQMHEQAVALLALVDKYSK